MSKLSVLVLISCSAITSSVFAAQPLGTPPNCWTDVTVYQPCAPGIFHKLQFKNNCPGGQRYIQVAVKWITGNNAGQITGYGGNAIGGQVAEITPGLCSVGDIRYTYNSDGTTPNNPN